MALYEVTDGDVAVAADVNQYKDVLEGAASMQYALHQATGADFIIKLPDASGTYSVSIQDSGGNEVCSIDSDGTVTPSGLIFPKTASPAQTANGQAVWDSDGFFLTVGNGTSRQNIGAGWMLVGSNSSAQTTTSTTAVDLVSITLNPSVTADQPLMIVGNFTKDASAAQAVALGLKLNSTTVIEAAVGSTFARSSATQQVEDGSFSCIITPRSTGYIGGNIRGSFVSNITASGAAAQAHTLTTGALTAVLPTATITTVVIRGINGTTSNNLAVKNVQVFAGAV